MANQHGRVRCEHLLNGVVEVRVELADDSRGVYLANLRVGAELNELFECPLEALVVDDFKNCKAEEDVTTLVVDA